LLDEEMLLSMIEEDTPSEDIAETPDAIDALLRQEMLQSMEKGLLHNV